jgi:hypothetical protein
VDGGDVTAIHEDPRDIGFLARKVAKGEVVPQTSGSFRSNSLRELRFGVDPAQQVARQARAPGPGTYVVESEWDKLKRKAQMSRVETATGKKMFGCSGSERKVFSSQANDVPGPGFYEIP